MLRFGISLTAVICLMLLIRSFSAMCEYSGDKNVPIIVYNGIGEQDSQVSLKQIENDIQYLIYKGYTAVFASDVAKELSGDSELPQKPIVLSFDGDHSSYYSELFPLLKKYRFKAVVTVNGKLTEYASNSADDNVDHLRWEQIKEMDSSGLVEFSNGTYSLWENGDFSQVNKESYEEYRSRIVSDIGQLQILFQQNCGFEPIVFTYPDGTFSDNSKRLVKNLGFTAAISTDSKKHSFDPKTKADPYRLKRYERAGFENISNLIE